MSIICIVVSVISASYYLKIIRVLHTESEESNKNTTQSLSSASSHLQSNTEVLEEVGKENAKVEEVEIINLEQGNSILSNSHSFLISTLTLSILLFVLKPSIILNSTQLLSLSLFYY